MTLPSVPTRRINDRGLAILKGHEKCVLRAYRDQGKLGGVWTIGWGHTGPEVVEGLFWTQEEADSALLSDLETAERAVSSYVHRVLNENQFSALVDFTFNEGVGTFFESSILLLLNQGDFAQACDHLALYDKMHVGGVKVPSADLARRRAEEQALFKLPITDPLPTPPPLSA